jgi:hypothetical protein
VSCAGVCSAPSRRCTTNAQCGARASAETRQLLEDTYGWFTEGFDTADLQEAKTLLGALR